MTSNADNYGPIRVSYSILNAWEHGDIERAVAPFIGKEFNATEAMAEGKKWHEQWERETLRTKRMPRVFGGAKLAHNEFATEAKAVIQINGWCILSGVFDLVDGTTIHDYKTGRTPASTYVNSRQHEVYKVLRPSTERFEYHCMNQHVHKTDTDRITMAIVHLTDEAYERGLEWVTKNAAELRQYLIENGLGDKLDRGKGVEL